MGEAGGGLLKNLPYETLYEGAGETSPPAFAAPYLHNLSRILFVFYFKRDSHGLFRLLFQKAKLLLGLKGSFRSHENFERSGL
jgi:hypothetical protein